MCQTRRGHVWGAVFRGERLRRSHLHATAPAVAAVVGDPPPFLIDVSDGVARRAWIGRLSISTGRLGCPGSP